MKRNEVSKRTRQEVPGTAIREPRTHTPNDMISDAVREQIARPQIDTILDNLQYLQIHDKKTLQYANDCRFATFPGGVSLPTTPGTGQPRNDNTLIGSNSTPLAQDHT